MAVLGRACIFLFPFGVHRTSEPIPPRVIGYEGLTLRIYAPFANSPVHVQAPTLDYSRIPTPPGIELPVETLLQIRVDARPGWNVPFEIADAMRVDIYGDQEEEALRKSAKEAVGRFLRLCRVWTRQWWILRGPSESREPFRNVFAVNGDGRASGPQVSEILHIAPWLGTERLLGEAEFEVICAALHADADPSFACMTLFDAASAASLGDRQRAILDAAIACEALFSEQAYALRAGNQVDSRVVRNVLNQAFDRRLCGGSRQLFGRAIVDDDAAGWAALQRLWIARHALAHGNPEQIARNAEINDQASFGTAFGAACRFFTWIARVRQRTFPDPMLAFEHPLINAT